jgi:transcriptional regulator with XRE-family HTH domain
VKSRSGQPSDATTYVEVLAANLRAERGRAGLSQKSLAARMQRLGFTNWAYQTVGKVENVTRPLFAAEVLGLALALGCPIPALMATTDDDLLQVVPDGHQIASGAVRWLATGIPGRIVIWAGNEPCHAEPPVAGEER